MSNTPLWQQWQGLADIPSKPYSCAYCDKPVSPAKGYHTNRRGYSTGAAEVYIYICHHCANPTYFDSTKNQHPAPVFGHPASEVSDRAVAAMYQEARVSTGAGAYTAAVLCCRKLLMHIAVSKGAPQNQSFAQYVQYLADNHYIPPDAKPWVDHIRAKGNEANHEIALMNKADAEELVDFSHMLLKVIFEFPAAVQKRLTPTPPSTGSSAPGSK
jgi:hypothetical protein